MGHAINRRSAITAIAAGAGLAITDPFTWFPGGPMSAQAVPVAAAAPSSGTANAALDTVVFGDAASEAAHGMTSELSQAIGGSLLQSARVFSPPATPGYWGGTATFALAVDPEATNYISVKLWGGDAADLANESHNWRLQLFIDGDSVGWYDEGPVDNLDQLGVDPRCPERFFLNSLPLPLERTKGKKTVEVEIRSMGRIWDYGGPTKFFYNQTQPSRPVYRAYSHSTPYFVPAADDVFGSVPTPKSRANTDDQAIAAVRARSLNDQTNLLYGGGNQQMDAWQFNNLAEGYSWPESPAYKNPDALATVCEAIDGRYWAWKADPTIMTGGDQQWQGFGRVGLALAYLWEDIQSDLDKNVTSGQTRLANPGFEAGTTLPVGWKQNIWQATGTAARDASVFRSGTASAKLSVPSTGGVVGLIPNGRVLVGPGTYTYGAWVKVSGVSGTKGAYLDVLFRNAAGTYVGSDHKFYAKNTITDWQQVTAMIDTPAGATTADIQLRLDSPGTAWFDDITFSGPEVATGAIVARRDAYRDMLLSSRDYWKQNSRHYSNQAQICAIGIYQANRGLSLLSPADAWPEAKARQWIHESIGLAPWLGSERPDGSRTKPLGDDYYVVSPNGLTRELGYVGGYGEVTDWLVMMYESITRGHGAVEAPEVREQMLKIVKTRARFRHFDVDADGNRLSRLETVIGWRNEVYPGIADYVQPSRVDGSAVMAAGVFEDPDLTGWAQEMVADGQLGPQLALYSTDLATRPGLAATRTIARDLPNFLNQPASSSRMPMGWEAPDFVFTDEVAGAVAVKHGQEILFASLYWRARQGVNGWGRVHLLTPSLQRSATVREVVDGTLSQNTFTVQDWVTWDYAVNDATGGPSPVQAGGWTAPGPTVHQAFAGEVDQLAIIPAGIDPTFGSPTLGTEEALTGIAPFYQLEYGPYIILMNTTKDQTFRFKHHSHGSALVLTEKRGASGAYPKVSLEADREIGPRSTVVLYKS